MRYYLYDQNQRLRQIECNIEVSTMREYISEFKTHCVLERSAYEFNHFINYMKKYKGVTTTDFVDSIPVRVDM